MKVTSPAGELYVTITDTSVENDAVVVNAVVGVWNVGIHLGKSDICYFFSLLFRRDVLLFILKQFFQNF
jgi:hypothetical protein